MTISKMVVVGVIGCYQAIDAYPNVKFLLRSMETDARISLAYLSGNNTQEHFNKVGTSGFFARLITLFNAFWVSWVGVLGSIKKYRNGSIDCVYVPYPTIFSLLLYAIFPKAVRPPVVADVFISLYDTVTLDRELCNPKSILGRLLYVLEKASFSQADVITVDTQENKAFLIRLFGLKAEKVSVLPLSIDEAHYRHVPYSASQDPAAVIKVLFFGSLVPLHGIDVIVAAANRLSSPEYPEIKFLFVGDGQTAPILAEALSSSRAQFEWKRGWLGASELAELIAGSDICLGVFGKSEKSRRVWPFKNYLAMSVGRCIVSGASRVKYDFGKEEAYVQLESNDPDQLAEIIAMLARNWRRREAIASAGHRLYQERLANSIALEGIVSIFRSLS